MSARRASFVGLLGAAVAVVLVIVTARSEEPYRLRVVLTNASGLQAGSEVRIGDVTAGKVGSIELGHRDAVVAELELHADQAPVGSDASLAISSLNLLGQKYVALDKGDTTKPAPSGSTIPRSRVTTSTDLDQLLAVLDGDTRARLAILINEAGFAMSGRRADFNALLRELPQTTAAATRLLEEFVADNRTLGHLVERSDRFVADITRERRSLSRVVQVTGETGVTVAARRRQVRQTLARAPHMLQSLQRFLGELRSTTQPLGPAARNITASAPALVDTLAEIEPFRRAASPALAQARAVAPSLTRLALGATPVLRSANPAVHSLATFSQELVPLTETLDRSLDNLFAIVHNWSRVVQNRDSFSHLFNAQAVITPETARSLVRRLAGPRQDRRSGDASRTPGRRGRPANDPPRGAGGSRERLPAFEAETFPGDLPGPDASPVSRLLGYLLGP